MGYDVYVSFNTTVPDAATAEQVYQAFFETEYFGSTLYVEWGDTYVYGTWEGRNRDEEEVARLLQPLADQFGVTFDVTYNSDYDDSPQTFFVGADATARMALYQLDQLQALLMQMGGETMTLPVPADQLATYRHQLQPQLARLLTLLTDSPANE